VAKHDGYTLALKENHPEVSAEAWELFEYIDEPGGFTENNAQSHPAGTNGEIRKQKLSLNRKRLYAS
jgi:hypothetical protein